MSATEPLDRLDAAVLRYDHLTGPLLRGGLGAAILLAGAHKLVAPGAWHRYLAPAFAALWPSAVAPLDPVFVAFGVSEVAFGVLLLADWHTPTVAAATALSLAGVVVNLAVAILGGEPFVDVLVRDVGLTLYAAGVAVSAACEEDGREKR